MSDTPFYPPFKHTDALLRTRCIHIGENRVIITALVVFE